MRTVTGSNSLRLRHAPGDRPHLAVDLGGTRLRAALVDAEGHLLERCVQPTPRDERCPEALEMLARGLLDQCPVSGAVIWVPGRVDYAAGELEFAPNPPPGWVEELSPHYLTESLGVRTSLANDADLAALGEASFGACRGHQDVVCMTVSTGIGAGVFLGGRLVRGRLSLAEVGHTMIDLEALGRAEPTTLDELGSGTALGWAAQAAGLAADARQLAQLVRRVDAMAVAIWKRGAEAVAIGVLNLVQTFSPEVVVIGGGVGRSALLLDPIPALLAARGLAGAAGWASAFHGSRSEWASRP